MKYEYQGIKLGDTIEKIIHLLNNKNTKFDDFYSYLIYEPGSTIEDIPTKIFIYLYTGTVVMIQVIDENYCLAEDLRVGTPISKEIIEKYGLYEDDIAEDEGYYESTKYKELGINIDWGTGRLKRYNDRVERIIGYTFDGQDKINLNIRKDEVDNYLQCKNLKDIFHSLKKIYAIEVDVDKREIYGQLDNYKFTFDIITRDIKSIQNLETGEFIKIMKGVKDNELKKIEYSQHCILYYYALLTLIIFDFIAGVFFIINLIRFELLIFIIVFGIMTYFFTRAIVNCLKFFISKEECYCINENLIYKRILFKKFLLKELKIPLLDIEEVLDKGHVYSENGGRNYVSPTDFVFLFFKPYKRVLLNLKRGIKYDIFTYTYPYPYIEKEIYDDTDFLKSFDELKEMIEEEQKKILFNQKVENLSEKYNFPLEERYSYILNQIIDEEKLFISEKDNNFIINEDSEAIKDLEIFKDMNFEEIDFYVFYVNYLSKKEYENKKVLVGYNGIDGKEVTISKLKEDINEIRDSRSKYGREVEK